MTLLPEMIVSVVICTYNRSDLLTIAITSLLKKSFNNDQWELLIIDNNSTDNTSGVANWFIDNNPNKNIRYAIECNVGLSHARNLGMNLAKGIWICYLDDDMYISDNFFTQLYFTIKNQNFDLFGGQSLPWYKNGKKIDWYESYHQPNINSTAIGIKTRTDQIYGSVMAFKTDVLKSLNGFPVELGMAGSKVAYGEETAVVLSASESGYSVGVNPFLIIYHLVDERKQSVLWTIKSAFCQGRDGYEIYASNRNYKGSKLFDIIKQLTYRPWINLGRSMKKVFYTKGFDIINLFLAIAEPISYNAGKLYGLVRSKLRNTSNY